MNHRTSRANPVVPRSRCYLGSFGRLFPSLPPWHPENVPDSQLDAHFLSFAGSAMVENQDAAGDSVIPAGYTYFGQFVDHDLTLDITPLSQSDVDPERLHNFRTPRLDLDCVYGRGPGDQPYLYELDEGGFTGKLLKGIDIPGTSVHDLPRNSQGRALIGDMRNDENAIVAQVQLAFLLAHNTLVDRAKDSNGVDGQAAFDLARRTLCWLYQWIVWNDFLHRVTAGSVHGIALSKKKTLNVEWSLGLKDIFHWKIQPFIPVEFSVAAYRFGHSLVRNDYETNATNGPNTPIPLFADDDNDLEGFRVLEKKRVVQWDRFLEMKTSQKPFPQRARKIDRKLSRALENLPEGGGDSNDIQGVLAARNLVRGVRMRLPSGPDVARRLGVTPLQLQPGEPQALWYYILKEAEEGAGKGLGQVGSRIVCAVFAGILKGDPLSWMNLEPKWTPDSDPLLDPQDNRDSSNGWTLASIIRLAGLPVADGDL